MVAQHPALLHWLSMLLAAGQPMQSHQPPSDPLAVHLASGRHPKLQACLLACTRWAMLRPLGPCQQVVHCMCPTKPSRPEGVLQRETQASDSQAASQMQPTHAEH